MKINIHLSKGPGWGGEIVTASYGTDSIKIDFTPCLIHLTWDVGESSLKSMQIMVSETELILSAKNNVLVEADFFACKQVENLATHLLEAKRHLQTGTIEFEREPDGRACYLAKINYEKSLYAILNDATLRSTPCFYTVLNFLVSILRLDASWTICPWRNEDEAKLEKWISDFTSQASSQAALNKLTKLKQFTGRFEKNANSEKEKSFQIIYQNICELEKEIKYIIKEMTDLKRGELKIETIFKRSDLSNSARFVNDELPLWIKKYHDWLAKIEVFHQEIYDNSITHRDKGIKGFLKLNFFRATASEAALEQLVETPQHFKTHPHPPGHC